MFSTLSHVLDSIFGPWLELDVVSGVFSGEKGGEDEVLGPCWYLRMIDYERFLLVMNNRGSCAVVPCDKSPQRLVNVEVQLEKELVLLASDLLEDVAKQL